MSPTEPTVAPAREGRETAKLHRRALSVPDLVFFVVAASAPLTAVAGGQAATYLVTGNRAVPFMFIPLGIILALIAVFYALSSWLLGAAAGFDTIVDPEKLVQAGYATGGAPDPTTVLFVAGAERLGAIWGTAAALLFATSLFAALLSFHNAVARYMFALGREGVIPSIFGRVHRTTGAPWTASLSQSTLAFLVVGIFAVLGADPILQLFTWLTNMGALGVLLLMAVTSFAVVGYFRRNPESELSRWRSVVAPAVAGVLLLIVLVLGVANFNVLITGSTEAPVNAMAVVLPAILFGGGAVGLAVGALLKRRNPEIFASVGEGAGAEAGAEGPTRPDR